MLSDVACSLYTGTCFSLVACIHCSDARCFRSAPRGDREQRQGGVPVHAVRCGGCPGGVFIRQWRVAEHNVWSAAQAGRGTSGVCGTIVVNDGHDSMKRMLTAMLLIRLFKLKDRSYSQSTANTLTGDGCVDRE